MGLLSNAQSKRWEALFPTRGSFVIFILYMALFINQGIVVKASQKSDHSYNYNTVTVVLLTEATKLVACLIKLLQDNSLAALISDMRQHIRILGLYLVPSILYCFYNNLAFVNLTVFDPTTYFMLLQLRVVITGIIFQVVFKKQLSCHQWVSLLILTAGCIIKQISIPSSHNVDPGANPTPDARSPFSMFAHNLVSPHILLIFFQLVCSCLAGVYNEKLLKDTGAEVDIMLQNVFMYIDSIACNAVILGIQGQLYSAFTSSALAQVWQPSVLTIIINNAAVGIVTSLFLRSLNSILKTFASALELVFIAVLSWMIFGIPIDVWTATAIALVTYATFMYAQNPVVNRGRLEDAERATSSMEQQEGNEEEAKLVRRLPPPQS